MKDKKSSFICIGAVHIDKIINLKSNYILNRTNPSSQQQSLGGVAYNIASKIALFDENIELISLNCVENIKKKIKKKGIKFKTLNKKILDRSYTSILDRKGKLILGLADMNVYEQKLPLLKLKFNNKKKIIFDLNLPEINIKKLINQFYKKNIISICGTSHHKVVKIKKLLNKIHILILNKQESLSLTKKRSINNALKYLIKKNNNLTILITNGKNKIAGYNKGKIYYCNPPKIKIKNENGAGDTMSALFIYYYFKSLLFKDILSKSVVAGSLHAKGYKVTNKKKYLKKIDKISRTIKITSKNYNE